MENLYTSERNAAIRTLCAVVDAYQSAIEKRIDCPPNSEDVATITAYIQAETVLLRLLKEEVTDYGEGGGDYRRRVNRPVRK